MELLAEADYDEDEADAVDSDSRRQIGLGWTGSFCWHKVCPLPLCFVSVDRCFWMWGFIHVDYQLDYRFLIIVVIWFGRLSAPLKADGLILSVFVILGDRYQGASLTICWYLCLSSVRIDILILPYSVATLLATLFPLWTPKIRQVEDPSSGASDGYPSGLSAFAICLKFLLFGANTNMSVGGGIFGYLALGIQSPFWFLKCSLMYAILNDVLLLFVNEIA